MKSIVFYVNDYGNFLGTVSRVYYEQLKKDSSLFSVYENINYSEIDINSTTKFPCDQNQNTISINQLTDIEKKFLKLHNRVAALYRKHNIPHTQLWWYQDKNLFEPVYKQLTKLENIYENKKRITICDEDANSSKFV
jgi:hypothetical protein